MWCIPPEFSKAGLCGPTNAVFTCVHWRYPAGYGTASFGLALKDKLKVVMQVATSARKITLLRPVTETSVPVFSRVGIVSSSICLNWIVLIFYFFGYPGSSLTSLICAV